MTSKRDAPRYVFAFDSPYAALRYCQRLFEHLTDIAYFRSGEHVIVIDGRGDQRRTILRLSRESGAIRRVRPPRTEPE